MLTSYRTLLARPGAPRLALICACAWLAYGADGLALLLAFHHLARSYADAGLGLALFSLGAGPLAPLRGRLVADHGSAALRGLAGCHLLAGAGLVLALHGHRIAAGLITAAALGASAPPIIAVARTRWSGLAGPELARTGHALNAALSDLAQMVAPPLVAGVSLLVSPLLALGLGVAGAGLAALALAATPANAPAPTASGGSRAGGLLRAYPGLRLLVLGDAFTVTWLTGLDVAVIARAGVHGRAADGGFVLAAGAVGSIALSLLSGAGRVRGIASVRYRAGLVIAALGGLLLLCGPGLPLLAGFLLVIGAGYGLTNVAVYELLDAVVPAERATEAYTWLTGASAAGAALGATVAGRLAERGPETVAGFVAGVAVAGAVAVSLGARALRAPDAGTFPAT